MSAKLPTHPGHTPVQGAHASRSPAAGLIGAWPEGGGAAVGAAAWVQVRKHKSTRQRDMVLSAVIALGLHGAAAALGFLDSSSAEQMAAVEPEETYVPIEMPVLEPQDTIEVVDTGEAAPTPPEMAPPMMLDLPSTVPVSNFLQPMQPQLDPALTSVSALKIPAMTGSFGQPGSPGVKLFDLSELDRVPRRLQTVVPNYPIDLRRAGISGEVVLLVIIDPSGHVEIERVIRATNPEFAAAASRAALQCVFESPLKGGRKVSARYTWRIPFTLQ